MQNQQNIIDCYNRTAKQYADKFMNELAGKHFDKLLLTAFAEENKDRGKMIDLGCGPGQTTKFLYDRGATAITGTDLSAEMINVAKQLNPEISFELADMLKLQYADDSFGAAIAFYSIVHFDEEQILIAFNEIRRILKPSGELLFSFHVGNNTIHLAEFLDEQVNIDFNFFESENIKVLIRDAGLEIIDVIERQPYVDIEYPSQRAYVWVKKA